METPTRDVVSSNAFRSVFDTAYPELVRYAKRRVNGADVDDVVSEVFVTAWRRWSACPDPQHPLPWLYGIAANVVRNRVRGDRRRLRLVERITQHRPQTSVAGPGPGPTDDVLAAALDTLSFDDQELLRLIAWERLTHAEVGEVLGCSANAVAIRVHRAKGRLAAALGKEHRSAGHVKDEGGPSRD